MPTSDPLVIVRYLDILLVVLAAPFVLLMGGPVLGYTVAAVAWIVTRFGAAALGALGQGRREPARQGRRRFRGHARAGSGSWGSRSSWSVLPVTAQDGLMAALLALVAFSVYFGHAARHSPDGEEYAKHMSQTRKILYGVGAVYLLLAIAAAIFLGSSGKNEEFKPQNEFKLDTWFSIGPIHFTKAVLYLLIAAALTIGTMVYVARRMTQRPNRVQTAVEFLYTLMRDNITRGNMDDKMAAKWFPFIGSLFLFIWFSNLIGFIPLPVNSAEKVELFGVGVPAFQIYAATANLSIPLVFALVVFIVYTGEGIRVKGVGGYLKSLIPAGVHGPMVLMIFPLEILSNLMRIISLSVRLFANMLAGHLIILFMAGGLAILLGTAAIGVFLLPLGWAIYLFEVGLVATLQAFIFATLSAIYIGGSVAESH